MTTAKKPSKPAKPSKAKPRPGPKNQQRGSSAVGERLVHTQKVGRSTRPPASTKPVKPTRPDVKVFIAEYLRDSNGRRAAIAAGYSEKTADSQASRLLKTVKVRAEVDRHEARIIQKVQEDTGITKAKALAEAWAIVTANANELIEYRRTACSGCHGGSNTRAELARDPDPNCSECLGEGNGMPFVHDTRKLSPQAMALYAGIKLTKEGLEVKMHSKMDALEKVFKHLGLYKEDNDQKGKSAAGALREFFAHLHAGAGRLPIVKSNPLVRG